MDVLTVIIIFLVIVFVWVVFKKNRKESFDESLTGTDCLTISGILSEDINTKKIVQFQVPIGMITTFLADPLNKGALKPDLDQKVQIPGGKTIDCLEKSIQLIQKQSFRLPIGSVIIMLYPIGSDKSEWFEHCGYVLLPLGSGQSYPVSGDIFKTFEKNFSIKSDTKIPSMQNKTMFCDDGIEDPKTIGEINIDESQVGFSYITQEDKDITGENEKVVQYVNKGPNVDTRDKGNIVYYYLILDYVD